MVNADWPLVIGWIGKLLLITIVIFLSKKFSNEIEEASEYFRFDIWISLIIGTSIVGSVLVLLFFLEKRETGAAIFDAFLLIIRLTLPLLIMLIIGRVVYKKFIHKEVSAK